MRNTPTRFRFQATKVFLTYPQCTLSKETLYNALNEKTQVKHGFICIEQHEDGNTHLHAAIEFNTKINTRSQAYFDVNGFHPNIQAVRNWNASVNYVKKEGDWEEYGDEDTTDQVVVDNLFELARTMEHNEYYTYCLRHRVPLGYAQLAWRQVADMFTVGEEYSIPEDATVRADLMATDITGPAYDNRSIVLIGPSGAGKTLWAKHIAEKPALFVTHADGLRNLQPTHRSIIFDDMSYLHVPREAQITITDRFEPRQIHVRYGTVSVPAGIQKIFTANQEIFLRDPAVDRRTRRIILQ